MEMNDFLDSLNHGQDQEQAPITEQVDDRTEVQILYEELQFERQKRDEMVREQRMERERNQQMFQGMYQISF